MPQFGGIAPELAGQTLALARSAGRKRALTVAARLIAPRNRDVGSKGALIE
jgi:hypothetical protein